jgi:hypothetical protein
VDHCVAHSNVGLHNIGVVFATLLIAHTLNEDLHFAILDVDFQGCSTSQGSCQLLSILQLGSLEGSGGHDVVLQDL